MSKKKKIIIAVIAGGALLLAALVGIGIKVFGGRIISESEAKDIAFNHAQVNEMDVENVYAYLDRDDWDKKYHITFHVADSKYDYEINARTGNIEDFDVEGMRNSNAAAQETPATPEASAEPNAETPPAEGNAPATTAPNNNANNRQSAGTSNAANATAGITEAEAKTLVLERVEGATEADVWMKLDREDGRLVYEGQIIYNAMEYDFEIDANDGTFYSWEVESVHD